MEYELKKEEELDPQNSNGSVLRSVFELFEDFVLIFGIFCIALTFIVRQISVDGPSMEPNYQNEERVLITGQPGNLKQGDVVVVVNAISRGPVIKRVIAVEGQIVEFDIENGRVIVDGAALDDTQFSIENGITYPYETDQYEPMTYPVLIPKGEVFVLGDNRGNSTDSRAFGVVDTRNVLGKAIWKFYPISEFGEAK